MALGTALAGGLGFLGDQISYLENTLDREWFNNPKNKYSDAWLTQYLKDYDKQISDYFLDKQIDYNKWAMDYQTNLMNTAYQRAVADMKAAGINPASIAGTQVSSASSPNPLNANSGYHSGAQALNTATGGASDKAFAALASSAIMAAVAKDNNAARIMASEIVDNARHAHKLEELQERHEMNLARDYENSRLRHKYHNEKEAAQADYYSALAHSITKKNR